jgi:hypothetical protein
LLPRSNRETPQNFAERRAVESGQHKQQSRRPREANGFALSPIRAVLRQSLGCRIGGEGVVVSGYYTFRPSLPLSKRGTANPTEKDYRSHDGFFAVHRVRTWGKERPRHAVEAKFSTQRDSIQGRAATMLPNAGRSGAAARRCRDKSLRLMSTAPRLSKTKMLCPSAKNCDVRFGTLSSFPHAAP